MQIWRHKLVIPVAVGATFVIGIILFFKFHTPKLGPWEVTVATGTRGGTYWVLGEQFARILEGLPGKPIKSAKAEMSDGSRENITRLLNGEADIAFVNRISLMEADKSALNKLRILARLYRDVIQVVVRNDLGINKLSDLKGRNIYIGAKGSGTMIVAEYILESILGWEKERDYIAVNEGSFSEASEKLIDGGLDAAIIMAGRPTKAVQKAIKSGVCKLIALDDILYDSKTGIINKSKYNLKKVSIPVRFYEKQSNPILTVGTDVYLVSNDKMSANLGNQVVSALFDYYTDLMLEHSTVKDIRLATVEGDKLHTPFDERPRGIQLHEGASKFKADEDKTLYIATGAFNGRYYNLGQMIQKLLDEIGIRARVIHTDGSLENAKLMNLRPTLAIVQYDVALASRRGKPMRVYGDSVYPEVRFPEVDIHRIATFHEEKAHVIVRSEKLGKRKPTISALRGLKVCVGPENSGSRLVAQTILKHHDIPGSITANFLPVSDMVTQLHTGGIDAGFFVSFVPSEALKTVLSDTSFRLLSIEPKARARIIGPSVFWTSAIESDTYACQADKEPAIQTISTQAVLVTTKYLNGFDVKTITKAIFEGEAFLGIQGGAKAMAKILPSLPLHPEAEAFYKEAGYLPQKPSFNWLEPMSYAFGILVILVVGLKGFIAVKRDRTKTEVTRRILDISLKGEVPRSKEKLRAIDRKIGELVQRRWWHFSELDKPRWQELKDLINERSREASQNRTWAFVQEICAIGSDSSEDVSKQAERTRAMREDIVGCLNKGEIDSEQFEMLMRLLTIITEVNQRPEK